MGCVKNIESIGETFVNGDEGKEQLYIHFDFIALSMSLRRIYDEQS